MLTKLAGAGLIAWITTGFGLLLYFQLTRLMINRASLDSSEWNHHRTQLLAWAGCAPLLGLLGTVHGLVSQFTQADIQAFGAGISQALLTTKIGLIIAIPAWSLLVIAGPKQEEAR